MKLRNVVAIVCCLALAGTSLAAEKSAAAEASVEVAESAESLASDPVVVLTILLALLAGLFGMAQHETVGRVFKVVPLLVFAYFVPTLLSNVGVLPLKSPLYDFVRKWLLPASLLLLTMSVDIPAILRLGPKVLILFLGATASIVVGGPLAYLALGSLVPADLGDQAWKGLAALSGSWIGGGANFVAIGDSVQTKESTLSFIVVVDVLVASVWMAVLLYFARWEHKIDARAGADRTSLEALRQKVEKYQAEFARPTSLAALLAIAAIAFGGTAIATKLSQPLHEWCLANVPGIDEIFTPFTWVVLFVTALGILLSFTPCRRLEGVGASHVGSVFLYLLVTTIGAKANFAEVLNYWQLLPIGALWMLIHAATLLYLCRRLRAPIFFLAVGSQSNVGGAASAPVVASAFHPSLASVGALLAVGGYVLGTYAGLACAYVLRLVHGLYA